jgi:alpha-galactosidase
VVRHQPDEIADAQPRCAGVEQESVLFVALRREGRVDFLKWDLNRALADAPAAAALRHEAGFRAVVDRLRWAHPGLWMETCASGGGRADLATLSRFELAWPSDNTDAFERLAIQDGYAFVHASELVILSRE